jgi:hypothetical protein
MLTERGLSSKLRSATVAAYFRRMKKRLSCAAVFALTLFSSSASFAAGDAHGMAEKGHIFISADRLVHVLAYTYRSTTRTNPNGSTVTSSTDGAGLSLLGGGDLSGGLLFGSVANPYSMPRPAVDITVIPHLTLGIAIPIGFGLSGSTKVETKQTNGQTNTSEGDAPSATLFGVVPRVGYILPVGDILAIWPRVGFGFYSLSTKSEDLPNNPQQATTTTTTTDTLFSLDIDPQLAIVPTEHFFFTVGPLLNIPITGSETTRRTTGSNTQENSDDLALTHLGISASLGGWINAF